VPSIKEIRISPPGLKAALIDISTSGLLAEWGVALRIGQVVTVNFDGTSGPQSVEADVVRSSVASMTSAGVRYHVGLAFKAPISLDNSPPVTPAASAPEPAAVADVPQPDDIVNQW